MRRASRSARGDETKHPAREVGAILDESGIRKRRQAEGFMFALDSALLVTYIGWRGSIAY